MELLIHSLHEFRDIILPALEIADARDIVEIGAEYGGMSAALAEHARGHGGRLTSIDPAPKPEFVAWAAENPAVRHIAQPSLAAIPGLTDVDAWVIDGDHNWYTVFNELTLARGIARRDGRPLLAFLHDIGWPSGRRDMYYAPEQIPAAFRHAYDASAGALPGHDALVPGRGFRGAGHFAWARHEGGPRNGVLTAVEDFVAAAEAAGDTLCLAQVPAVFGLGVVFDAAAPWAEALASFLMPWHDNALLARMEQSVIDWQDRAAA